jgi:rhodanese-related sulfurtransferase
MLKENADLYLLDVRTPQEYFQARLAGAHLIPIDKFLARIGEVPTDRPLLIYCAVGARSSQVAEYLVRKGYSEVYDLRGGIEAWAKLYRLPILSGAP